MTAILPTTPAGGHPSGMVGAPEAAGEPALGFFHFALLGVLILPNSNPFITTMGWMGFAVLLHAWPADGRVGVWPGSARGQMLAMGILAFVGLQALATFIRLPFGVTPAIRDLAETFRFVPAALIFLNRRAVLTISGLLNVVAAYIYIDGVVSLIQFFVWPGRPGFLEPLFQLYSSDRHLLFSLFYSRRTLGLGNGPGDHALIVALAACIILGAIAAGLQTTRLQRWAVALAAFVIFTTQSQTIFIALGCILVLFAALQFRSTAGSVRVLLGSLALPPIAVLVWQEISDDLFYLDTLFTQGFERNAFQRREEKWFGSIDHVMTEDPYLMPIGWGKDYLGSVSGALDNDFIFVFVVYGMVGILLLGLTMVAWVGQLVRIWQPDAVPANYILAFMLTLAVPSSLSNSFFLDLRVLGLASILWLLAPTAGDHVAGVQNEARFHRDIPHASDLRPSVGTSVVQAQVDGFGRGGTTVGEPSSEEH